MLRFLAVLVVIAGVVAGSGYLWFRNTVEAPGPSTAATRVMVERGSGVATVAAQLEKAGVIRDSRVFRVLAKVRQQDRVIRAGEYRLPPGASMEAVLALLVEGKTVVHRITFPEGMTTYAILDLLEKTEGLSGPTPDAEAIPEGSLLPATYDFSWNTPRAQIIHRMQQGMRETIAEAWSQRDGDLPLESPEELVILASIVEKETGLSGERAEVAGVFVNRLRRGMKLQTDPTVIYAVTGGKAPLGRGIRRSELAMAHPYNTYHITGLPPGPIANPGKASLMAAAQPAETDALYFVADGTGGHAFARTLAEHNENVRRWRAIERKRKAAE